MGSVGIEFLEEARVPPIGALGQSEFIVVRLCVILERGDGLPLAANVRRRSAALRRAVCAVVCQAGAKRAAPADCSAFSAHARNFSSFSDSFFVFSEDTRLAYMRSLKK